MHPCSVVLSDGTILHNNTKLQNNQNQINQTIPKLQEITSIYL